MSPHTTHGAVPVLAGRPLPGVGDIDYFKTVVADERTLTVFSTGLTDTVAVLEDAAGRMLDADDDGGDGPNFLIRERVRPGVYYVRVQGYRLFADGEYYLSIDGDGW